MGSCRNKAEGGEDSMVLKGKKEEELIASAQNGNEEAMAVLLERYKSLVRALSRPLFLMDGDQDDLLQEGMIGLYKAIQTFQDQKNASFETFATLCIKRQLYSAIKASNRKKNIPLNSYISIDNAQDPTNAELEKIFVTDAAQAMRQKSPEDIIIGQENVENTQKKMFMHLSNMEKQVLELFLQGLTYQEIAQKMEKSPKTIDNALQRIKKKVAKKRK